MIGRKLARLHCAPGTAATPKLGAAAVKGYRRDVPGWKVINGRLFRRFTFTSASGSMRFAIKMARLANLQQHHPDFTVHSKWVEVTIWTHSIGGLSLNDFILAAKISWLAGYRYI